MQYDEKPYGYFAYSITTYVPFIVELSFFTKPSRLNPGEKACRLSPGNIMHREYILLDKGYLGIQIFVYIVF